MDCQALCSPWQSMDYQDPLASWQSISSRDIWTWYVTGYWNVRFVTVMEQYDWANLHINLRTLQPMAKITLLWRAPSRRSSGTNSNMAFREQYFF